jgi:7-cyano-7-deazaguanine synthase
MKAKKAIVLSSGGIDSTTAMAVAKKTYGFDIYSLSFQYGQRHELELEAARKIAAAMGAKKHLIVRIDLTQFGGSALTDDIEVPKGRSESEMGKDIPVTYVPARNTIFLSFALAWAEVLKISDIFIGVNAVDYSGYPDCRPEFISAYQNMANLAGKLWVEGRLLRIHAPLIYRTKKEIIQLGHDLGVDYALTHSCYDPIDGKACGACDSCIIRKRGFEEANLPDPTIYVE